mmetsp:Transcript_16268/g.56826  ORF Transcript_16268/g.56826 Transcript_16268/m.56826 type:complete len:241 (+) Transcript_16268:2289-3011(+)
MHRHVREAVATDVPARQYILERRCVAESVAVGLGLRLGRGIDLGIGAASGRAGLQRDEQRTAECDDRQWQRRRHALVGRARGRAAKRPHPQRDSGQLPLARQARNAVNGSLNCVVAAGASGEQHVHEHRAPCRAAHAAKLLLARQALNHERSAVSHAGWRQLGVVAWSAREPLRAVGKQRPARHQRRHVPIHRLLRRRSRQRRGRATRSSASAPCVSRRLHGSNVDRERRHTHVLRRQPP